MFWIIVGALLFVIIGVPVIILGVLGTLLGIQRIFESIIDFFSVLFKKRL